MYSETRMKHTTPIRVQMSAPNLPIGYFFTIGATTKKKRAAAIAIPMMAGTRFFTCDSLSLYGPAILLTAGCSRG